MKTRTPSARTATAQVLLLTAAALPLQAQLTSHSFGSGGNSFTMDFVTVGNPANLPDTNPAGFGSVATTFLMGKYEVSEDMISKANAGGNLGITKDLWAGSKPATLVSWNEAARFVNWLNTSKGYSPAYKFSLQPGDGSYDANVNIQLWTVSDAGYNPANPYRNANAVYFLPSEHEWYKAAYFDPVVGVYYDYPTGSDIIPTQTFGSTTPGEAVFGDIFYQSGPADITNAGGLSPYGTMGQGGNVWEWNESAVDGGNDSESEIRGVRGGGWNEREEGLQSRYRFGAFPTREDTLVGFRVAAVPEPWESAGVIGLAVLGFALWRRRGSL